jgi:putative FmdB family regulatory protein
MPIYAYQCRACGHRFDRLQKLSDPDPTTCPACGAEAVARQVTAPSFRLAGSGWYETDFKSGGETRRNLTEKTEGASAASGESAAKPSAGDAAPSAAAPTPSAAAKPAAD